MRYTNNRYYPYKVINSEFAKGGNANVLLVKDQNGDQYVLKTLRINDSRDLKKVRRFINEIKIVEKYQNAVAGIIPIRYKFIPDVLNVIELDSLKYTVDLEGTEVWYVMDLAIPIKLKINNTSNVILIIDCMISLSTTLSKLHDEYIVHRDIKPNNLYFYNNVWAFGDFGLVSYPEFDSLTKVGERIGNYATIAPEMRHTKEIQDARPADVWSMAKTLWMLLTGNFDSCFEGIYNPNDKSISIKEYCTDIPIGPLDNIFKKATSYNPALRIDIKEFLHLLLGYKNILSDSNNVLSTKRLSELQENLKEPVLYNSADLKLDTNELIYNLSVNWESKEAYFIDKGLCDEIKVLKYIKMRLENYAEHDYVISPIIEHFRNKSLPAIKVFVKYTSTESKFVTFILCIEKQVFDFTHGYELKNLYDENRKISWDRLNRFVEIIDGISMKSVGNKNSL